MRLSHFIKEPAATREHKLAPNYFHVVLERIIIGSDQRPETKQGIEGKN